METHRAGKKGTKKKGMSILSLNLNEQLIVMVHKMQKVESWSAEQGEC